MKVWAYVHPQLNILCCALLPEVVPQGVQAIEFDVVSPEDVILDNGQIRLKTDAEKLQEAKQKKLAELKSYIASLLAPTDYIIIKIGEAQALGDTAQIEALKQKYSAQLQRREAIRQWNEQTKQAINNAQSLDELGGIVIEFKG